MTNKAIAISTIAGILTLSVLAWISITNQASAQAKPTTLTLGSYPNTGKVGSAGTLRVSLFGKLTFEDSEVGRAATIWITGTGEGKQETAVRTNEFGTYNTHADLGPGTHKIEAFFLGDAAHMSSSATKTIPVTP